MDTDPRSIFVKHLDCIEDPRHHNKRHPLSDILVISLCAIVSGADSWTQVAEYGRSKIDWFRDFLELPNGIPSHDTFGRLFARWIQDLSESIKGKTVAIDGKTLRGSQDRINGKSAIHMVSAWVADLRTVLGQIKTDAKSNEITAIPELVKMLDLKGAIVTTDAMGCQKKIARTIVEKKAEYVLQVKDNQKQLHQDITLFFQDPANQSNIFETVDGEHGRVETRRYATTDKIDWLQGKHEWQGLNSICMASRQREVNGKTSTENAYFISSLESQTEV